MSDADFNCCDICGEKVPKDLRLFFVTEEIAVSHGYEEQGEYVDLCYYHAIWMLQRLKKDVYLRNDFVIGRRVAKIVKDYRNSNQMM